MVSKKKPRMAAVKAAGKKTAPGKKAAPNEKAAPSRKAATGKAPGKGAGKITPKKKKASQKSEAAQHEVRPRTKQTEKSPAAVGAGARDPFEVARETMKGSVPAIVEAMVAKAKRGSCTHAKTLLEMTGAKHMFGDEAESVDHGEPWAKLVLERMDEAEQESLTKDSAGVAAGL